MPEREEVKAAWSELPENTRLMLTLFGKRLDTLKVRLEHLEAEHGNLSRAYAAHPLTADSPHDPESLRRRVRSTPPLEKAS